MIRKYFCWMPKKTKNDAMITEKGKNHEDRERVKIP